MRSEGYEREDDGCCAQLAFLWLEDRRLRIGSKIAREARTNSRYANFDTRPPAFPLAGGIARSVNNYEVFGSFTHFALAGSGRSPRKLRFFLLRVIRVALFV